MAFACVFLLGLLVPLAVAARAASFGEFGEAWGTPSESVRLFGPLFDDIADFKLRATLRRRPDVLVIGTSRVWQWRQSMFVSCANRPGCFYNAGGAMPTVATGLEFFRSVAAENAPRVLLVGLDFWYLNPAFIGPALPTFNASFNNRLEYTLAVVRRFMFAMTHDAQIRALLAGQVAIPPGVTGARAILYDEGFHVDGSWLYSTRQYAEALGQSSAIRSARSLPSVLAGTDFFQPFSKADPVALRQLEELLDLAAAYGTRVVAFTPPFSGEVAAAIDGSGALSRGVADIERTLISAFAKRDIPLLDGRRVSDFGCAADEHWDGIHPTEVCVARLLLRLLEDARAGPILAPYADAARLRTMIDQRSSALSLLPRE